MSISDFSDFRDFPLNYQKAESRNQKFIMAVFIARMLFKTFSGYARDTLGILLCYSMAE